MSRGGIPRAVVAAPMRLIVPEGLVLGALLALPLLPGLFAFVHPRAPLLLAAVVLSGFALGWRFARGRVVHGLLVLAAAAALPLLPTGAPTATLATVLVPLNLAAIALLPDRGIVTRGGLFRTGAIVLQAALIIALPAVWPAASPDPLAAITVPALGMTLDAAAVVYGAAIGVLAILAVATRAAPARGAFWATAGAFAAHSGHPGGATYLMAASGIVLLVAVIEDAHALAYRDALTGLPSRRALDELLQRTGRRFTVAMVDVDHFKAFNDRHGHDVGDQVLRMVAKKLKATGGGARAFRYGGEEFTLVFRGRTLEDAAPHLDALREAIAGAEFVLRAADRPKKRPRPVIPSLHARKKLTVTVSIGAAARPDRWRPPAEVVKAADAALYQAKEAGRNRVVASRS
ncbi:MAG TPA: GGDEF domain-containing protein [Longimicrobiales bacterium]|nr:GGDEF domain-containing protein [Longimicrobiales bacterium]